MYVYIFEDGTTQKHSDGPTVSDCAAIDDGLLIVLKTDGDVHKIDENGALQKLPECEFLEVGYGSAHTKS